ncbi:hypothetical protein [Calothrix sp. PCC 6303]|uniref:hypothetical protein n=1 Tax=Calothrix sp. PCC 6303 TaxID=1170562 RepID=UPI0002FD89E7|nr:hypothetical protein [Calothrix sp. PCC 6303]
MLVASEDEFTVLEEIELLTVDIRGYASQILVNGRIENQQEAIEKLHSIGVIQIAAYCSILLGYQ